jgi:hypothetical protein
VFVGAPTLAAQPERSLVSRPARRA